CYYGSSYFDYW
nr:immunoglobulin heavy chain junction region [Mus musculus]